MLTAQYDFSFWFRDFLSSNSKKYFGTGLFTEQARWNLLMIIRAIIITPYTMQTAPAQ